MQNKLHIWLIAIYAVLILAALAWFGPRLPLLALLKEGRFQAARSEVRVNVPKEITKNSLVVFNFNSSGDADARYYAVGFARALADRLCCAPKCVTQQVLRK